MSGSEAPSSSALPESDGLSDLPPDLVEEEEGDQFDDTVPTRGYGTMRVAGLGGSAGSLPALQSFFTAMPADSGMAFVVIVHLAPEHESNLAGLLQRTTDMPVLQVQERVKLETDHVYVIPPGKQLWIDDGVLALSDMEPRTGKHVAVDLFFRTLADSHGPHAAAIVLSGADGDGAIGIKRIKERGGLGIAQVPEEAEHDGMPRSAIATGLVDWVLPVAEMPAKLLEYWRAENRLSLPSEEGPSPVAADEARIEDGKTNPAGEQALHEILSYLRVREGHDFSYYKRATILRRIGRRMQVSGIEDAPSYLSFLRTHPGEPTALLHDLLISVTNFFRDREAFAALEAKIPSLFAGKRPEDTVRVWVAACATGEEAYSVAMLLREHADTLVHPPKLQVFATDLDESAIQWAREGTYSETIAADVSEERLRRFFTRGHGHYKLKRETREIVLFALHDLLKDSPFSRLDLVTCRNLLIYLNRDAQARALDIFHFALQPEGILFLGTSESVDEAGSLFAVTDKKRRIFTRRAATRQGSPKFPDAGTLVRTLHDQGEGKRIASGPGVSRPDSAPASRTFSQAEVPSSWGQRHYQFIEHLAPPSVIVNREYEIVHLSAHAGRFLQVVGGGDPTVDLLRMAHPMLRMELRAVLYQAAQSGVPVEARGIPVELEGANKAVNLRVIPSTPSPSDCFLVVFQEDDATAATPVSSERVQREPESIVRHLEQEIERLRAQLRFTVEESEASKEEHKATNEELQAMNEELRSASEELETSREELQSINEELSTVNQELKSSVEELGRSNSDLQNLMASTQIATLFLDRDLCIQRYTPPAVALFNIIPTDVDRPLSDLTSRLDYPHLALDAAEVLDRLHAIELEVAHRDGRYFLARMLPYRTTEDRIAGVVLTFVDITQRRRAQEEVKASEARLAASEERLRLIIENAREYAIFSTDPELRVTTWNTGAEHLLGYSEDEIMGQSADVIFIPEDRAAGGPQQEASQALSDGRAKDERWHLRKDGSRFWGSGAMMAMHNDHGQAVGFVKILRDETQAREARLALEHSREELLQALKGTETARAEAEGANKAKDHFLAVLSHELRTPLTPVLMAASFLSQNATVPESIRDALKMIERNVKIEAHFIDDLLDLTRITRGQLEIIREPMDLHDAVHHAVEISTRRPGREKPRAHRGAGRRRAPTHGRCHPAPAGVLEPAQEREQVHAGRRLHPHRLAQ